MRRLLEPCWWILFLKITSSVLHYVVCFPGECRPPRGRGPGRRARGMRSCRGGMELGRRSRGPRRQWRVGGGRPGRREGISSACPNGVGRRVVAEGGRRGWPGKGDRGSRGVCSRSGLGGLGSQSRERKGTCSADPPPFVRARSLGLLGETGTMGECLCGFEGSRVRPSLRRVLKELRSGGGRDLLCCPPTLWGGWVPGEGSRRLAVDDGGCGEQSAF